MPLLSALSPYLYNPSTGAYDLTWSLPGGPAGNVIVPNAAVVEPRWAYNTGYNPAIAESAGNMPVVPNGTLDAMWNLLPYSDPNGTRYRFATRIIDMSSLLNLNTGWIANAYSSSGNNAYGELDPYGKYGAYIASAPILNLAGLNIDPAELTTSGTSGTPVQIGSGTTPGRTGVYAMYKSGSVYGAFYTLPVWQSALSEYELQFPSSGPPSYTYPTAPPAAFTTALFGTNSAMDLLTGAGAGGEAFGSPFYSRVATLMPLTLGFPFAAANDYFGSGYRSLYTTYSFGRDVAPINLGTTATGTAPPKVNLNAPISSTNIGTIATQLYTTLIAAGYNPQHAREFLVNYFTYRFDSTGYSGSPAYLTNTEFLTVPVGATSYTASLTGLPAGIQYDCMGTTAQPFLNEVDVKLTVKGGHTVVSDWAVEVVNPFPGSPSTLPCSNYSISITGAPTVPLTGATLGGSTAGGNNYIGVLAYNGGTFAAQATSDKDGFILTSTDLPSLGATVVVNLIRNVPSAPGGTVIVDSMTITLPAALPTGTTGYFDVYRNNGGTPGLWGCDSAVQFKVISGATDTGSIGVANLIASQPVLPGNPGVPLYDRFYSGDQVAPGAAIDGNYDLFNIDDFNCIARESCQGGTLGTMTLPTQIADNVATPVGSVSYNAGMAYLTPSSNPGIANDPVFANEAFQAALYFDFAYDPRAAYTVADAGFLDLVVTAHGVVGEIPPTVLAMTTLTDRSQSNNPAAAIALPEGVTDLVRQAGKININTAGPDVLYSAFSEDGALWNGMVGPGQFDVQQLVADTVGFRDRLTAGAAIAGLPTAIKVPTPGYNSIGYSGFVGTGFQSIADLLVAFIPTIESGTFPSVSPTTPTTIQQRDAAWADVENFLTVRSDTFAVYGLVQALRLNPAYTTGGGGAYTPGTYLPTDWYNANQGILVGTGGTYNEGSISTDPTNQNAEFILEGSRRFIAIVDRSYCNNGAAVQPHIVALKILPQ
ncbi:MAG: hypothetical protein ACYCUV_08355 [Phycisphaerae bacterium]